MSKLQETIDLLNETIQRITNSPAEWILFLDTAANNYKYSFREQALIYAQNPQATACADMEMWNKLGRWVNAGTAGIALTEETGGRMRLRYVFDVTDTDGKNVDAITSWRVLPDDANAVTAALEARFGKLKEKKTLEDALKSAAANAAEDALPDYLPRLLSVRQDSFLEELDEQAVEVEFRDLLLNSAAYGVLRRCGFDPASYYDVEDFRGVTQFNTKATISRLGAAVSEITETFLRETYAVVRNEQLRGKKLLQGIEESVNTQYTDANENEKTERGHDNGTDIYEERGLLHSQPDRTGAVGRPAGEIREDAAAVPEGARQGTLYGTDDGLHTQAASAGSTGNRTEPDGADDEADGEGAGHNRGYENDRSNALGTENEQHPRRGGGNHSERTDLQLNKPKPKAPPVMDGAFSLETPVQLSFFPTEEEQRFRINAEDALQAESEQPSAFSSPKNKDMEKNIDAALQEWNGDIKSKQAVVRYMTNHLPCKETAAFLRKEYGDNLPAFPVTMNGTSLDLPWAKVQRRISVLMKQDRFYTQAEQDNLDDIDPIAIRENLEQCGIVDSQLVDEEKLNNSPFIRQVMADVERITQEEQATLPDRNDQPVTNTNNTATNENDIVLNTIVLELGDRGWEAVKQAVPEPALQSTAENFRITDDHLGEGGTKTKYGYNLAAIRTLKQVEAENRAATPEEQNTLSRYVGWGGIAQAFDKNNADWSKEYAQLKDLLTNEEYDKARASTLNAHYTSPTVIKAIYEAIGNMGFTTGNILEPACGVGNFFGLLPESMAKSKLYGVELDSVTGRIARQLYPKADITVTGFETTDRRDFFDLAVGNVPFGSYKVPDRAYDKLGFPIHDYFFAKTLDQVRPGGVIAFITSRYTMDKRSPEVRRYIAQRAELLGAVRLPNNAFKANAGTEVTTDILFLQKRDRPIVVDPDWVHLGQTADGIPVNSYFADHPDMVLGTIKWDKSMYGDQNETTCEPLPDADLAGQLHEALPHIVGHYAEADQPDLGEDEAIADSIPADPNVRNYSYTVVDGEIYYRENSRMSRPELNATVKERIKGLVELRDCVRKLIDQQLDELVTDEAIHKTQAELNRLYDTFTTRYGLISSRGNSLAFSEDSSYCLLSSLENLDEDGNLRSKAAIFSKRTIRQRHVATSADTASEALVLSIAEKARVDMAYMASLTGKTEDELADELRGVIFRNLGEQIPTGVPKYQYDLSKIPFVTADEYLSGNVRRKLRMAEWLAKARPDFAEKIAPNIEALRTAQPKDLDASEIEVRLGATWIDKQYIQQFMEQLLNPPFYMRSNIKVNFTPLTAEWQITGKNMVGTNNVAANVTYGTERANAYRILEDTLNLRDVRIYDTVTDADGKERRVLNSKETTLAQQKQQSIKNAFQDWIWKDAERRQTLVTQYNEQFNSTRPREYDGGNLVFPGMNPEIKLREHQQNAVAHQLYGGNTLLAHVVGAGKTYEMIAAAMEAKRLGLCQKSLFVVPNHLIEQWASEFLQLYPSANILITRKKDFETKNRKKFCARIATGDYDAVILGHSQFEKIPVSIERQQHLLQEQIAEIKEGLEELESSRAEQFTVKQMERTKKSLQARLEKLTNNERKDDVVTFEQLGVDRLVVDEAHSFKNLFLYTKMNNVAGLSTTEAQKSSDMFLKCRYIDEITGGRGIVFATGTPVSNSMTELYTMMRYLQYDMLQKQNLTHFDCWASTFGETTTAIELAPEGTGYRARTRFAKFFNLPELMNLWKEAADIKTADQLHLPTPKPIYHTEVSQPTEIQKKMVQELADRAAEVHTGTVDPAVDNMLKITSDGRKLGLDQRIINPLLPDEPESKVNRCVDNIIRIWNEGQEGKLTQLVFCDISTPKGHVAEQQERAAQAGGKMAGGTELHALLDASPEAKAEEPFSVYADIRDKLTARGIPREQVAFIHDANTDARKKELFAKVRAGQVRVLMGSTFKMGAGMNVQDRLIALHDVDCPWRPGDLEQRSGRIIRQGNNNPEVHIYRYVTEATFDSYLWQTIENKQKVRPDAVQ